MDKVRLFQLLGPLGGMALTLGLLLKNPKKGQIVAFIMFMATLIWPTYASIQEPPVSTGMIDAINSTIVIVLFALVLHISDKK